MSKQRPNNKKQPKLPLQQKASNPETARSHTHPNTSTQLSVQLTEHIRTIAADHPEQTIQLLKHWIKD